MQNKPKFDGPIPGANFTSDTRNYPWHRPPRDADFVKIVQKAVKGLSNKGQIAAVFTLLEEGETIADYVTGVFRNMIANGDVPIDMAILAAGPIAKYIEVNAKLAGIDYERGWEQETEIMTPQKLRAMDPTRPVKGVMDTPGAAPDTAPVPLKGGFMAVADDEAAPEDTQASMLGYGDEE